MTGEGWIGVLDGIPNSLPGIDINAGLATTDGNAKLYLRLLSKFKDGQKDFAQVFRTEVERGNIPTAQRLAHTLKGVAGNLGAIGLQNKAKILEDLCGSQATAITIMNQLPELVAELAMILTGLEAALESKTIDPAPAAVKLATTVDLQFVVPIIDKLSGLLEDDDIASARMAEELLASLANTSHANLAAQIVKQVEAYDFESGLEVLAKLKGAIV